MYLAVAFSQYFFRYFINVSKELFAQQQQQYSSSLVQKIVCTHLMSSKKCCPIYKAQYITFFKGSSLLHNTQQGLFFVRSDTLVAAKARYSVGLGRATYLMVQIKIQDQEFDPHQAWAGFFSHQASSGTQFWPIFAQF